MPLPSPRPAVSLTEPRPLSILACPLHRPPRSPPAWERCYNRTLVVDASAAALQGCWEKELLPVGVAVR